jgi:uncharacterized Tic20 family protein
MDNPYAAPTAPSAAPDPLKSVRIWGMDGNTYCVLLNLSPFAGYISGGLGLILPVVMWLAGREAHPDIDLHGRIVINFMISWFIYCVVSGVLCFVLIGFPLLFFFGLLGIILPIVGAVRAADGIIKPYFTSITFLSMNPAR